MKNTDSIYAGLNIIQDSRFHKYGTDALLVSAFARGTPTKKALDLGCGGGVISLCLAHLKKAGKVVGVEIQKGSAALAAESVEINGLSDVVEIKVADFTEDIGFPCGYFDYAVANPPYMKATSGKACKGDERNIARHEIGCDIFSVCAAGAKYVKFGGMLYIVYRPDRISDLFAALAKSNFEPKRLCFVYARPSLAPCLVLVQAKSGAKSGCVMMPPFFIEDEAGNVTDAMRSVYEGGSI